MIEGFQGLEKHKEQLPKSFGPVLAKVMTSLANFYEKRGEEGDAEMAKGLRQRLVKQDPPKPPGTDTK